MGKVYAGDIGTVITIDMQKDISAATGIVINVRKPNDATTTWTPTLSGTNSLTYTTVSGDVSQSGVYTLQVELTLGDWTGSSSPVRFTVSPQI